MKKKFKRNFLFVFALVFAFSSLLFACNAISLSGGPASTATVFGNGGSAVVKGDYIYFANAYYDYTDLDSVNDNQYDSGNGVTAYAIYRAKLGDDGKVVLNDDGEPQNVDILSYNIGGYAYSGLYICGDYLYYTTPYSAQTSGSDTELVQGLVRFERVKLNGTQHQILYKTTSYSSDSGYNIVYVDGTTYITVLDDDKNLVLITCTSSNVTEKTVSTDVLTFATFEQTNIVYNETVDSVNTYVYFTKQNDDNDEYELYRQAFSSTTAEKIAVSSNELDLVAVKNDRVYFTNNSVLYSTVNGYTDVKCYSTLSVSSDDTAGTIVDYEILDDSVGTSLDRGILGVYYDGTNYSFWIYNGYGDGTQATRVNVSVSDSTLEPTLYATQDNEFYFSLTTTDDDDNDVTTLYIQDFTLTYENSKFVLSNLGTPTALIEDFSAEVDDDTTLFDFDTERIFVYESVDDSDTLYLKMFMINETPYTDDDDNAMGQYVGVLD